jgi:hypothetical protein
MLEPVETIRAAKSPVGRHSRAYKYQKVLDNRKHPIRNLQRRSGTFIALLTIARSGAVRLVKKSSRYVITSIFRQGLFSNLFPSAPSMKIPDIMFWYQVTPKAGRNFMPIAYRL